MKRGDPSRWEILRHRFFLTPAEKRVIIFVVAAFALGLATKHYRDAQSEAASKKTESNHSTTGLRQKNPSPFASPKRSRKPRKTHLPATPETNPGATGIEDR